MKMYGFRSLLAAVLLLLSNVLFGQTAENPGKGKNQQMEWWRNARFGMFIHWGLYSILQGMEWQTDHGEWIRTTAQIHWKNMINWREV
jgi:alpha-L-fucosidase